MQRTYDTHSLPLTPIYHSYSHCNPLAHSDAIWDISWSPNDTAISISADGSIRQWDSTSGQVSRSLPAHPLGLISLSVSPNGEKVLFNSLEGLTSLWDLQSGEIVGKHESYTRAGTDPAEPCEFFHTSCQSDLDQLIYILNSVVGIAESKRINLRVNGWFRKCHNTLCRLRNLRRT